MMPTFDKRFLYEISIPYTKKLFDDFVIKVYQQPLDSTGSIQIRRLDRSYIGSIITIDHSGFLHSFNDHPALITPDGDLYWYKNGFIHREDKPAIIQKDGGLVWYKNGKLHREGEPAVVQTNGGVLWYKDGQLHREDGPSMVLLSGMFVWYKDGVLHREDGPATIMPDGSLIWYNRGKLRKYINASGTQVKIQPESE